jgi:hypothetical protein
MLRLAASLVLIAACAAPQEPQPRSTLPPGATPPTPEAAETEPECREEAVTGSALTRTVCRTPEEIARDRRNAQEFHEQANRTPTPRRPD